MIGTRIPAGKRVINSVPPLNPADYSEANALNLMFLWDNMGTGDYMEDASILTRHLRMFLCQEQNSPNMTLKVNNGAVWFGGTFLYFAGANTPLFVAPAANPRIDWVCVNNAGVVSNVTGAEAASPIAPAIPAGLMPLCQVYHRVGEVRIRDNDTQEAGQGYILYDVRPFMTLGGSVINSIQKVSAVIAFAAAPFANGGAVVAITAVNLTKAFVILEGVDTVAVGGLFAGPVCSADLTAANQVTLRAFVASAGGGGNTVTVRAMVVEYQ